MIQIRSNQQRQISAASVRYLRPCGTGRVDQTRGHLRSAPAAAPHPPCMQHVQFQLASDILLFCFAGGGVLWCPNASPYKNAITTELFMAASAALAPHASLLPHNVSLPSSHWYYDRAPNPTADHFISPPFAFCFCILLLLLQPITKHSACNTSRAPFMSHFCMHRSTQTGLQLHGHGSMAAA